ncbi:hypothetical protein ABTK00_20395, partial [Acinetobacter baumannii]
NTGKVLLNQESLLKGFKLSNEDSNIDFKEIAAEIVKVDIEQIARDNYDTRLTKVEDPALRDHITE